MSGGLSRRSFLGVAAGGAALGAVGLGTAAVLTREEATAVTPLTAAVPFEGEHQAGITTPQQDRLHCVAFDDVTTDRRELATLLRATATTAILVTHDPQEAETVADRVLEMRGGRIVS